MPAFRLVPLLLLTAASPAVLAQSATPQLGTVVVRGATALVDEAGMASLATRTDQSLLDVSQSVQVVGPTLLDDLQARNLDDALSQVSGMAQAPTRAGTQDSFVRRGFTGSSSTGLLRDGARSLQPRNFSATTERIEVLKGPASVLYGIQEPGGVVNVVSKQPMETARTALQFDTEQAGGHGLQFDHTAPIAGTDWSYRLIASSEDRDSWRNFGVSRRTLLAPSLAWRSAGTELTLAYEYSDYDVPFDDGTVFGADGRPAPIPHANRLTEGFSRMKGQTDFLNARLQQVLNDQWTARANLSFNRSRYDDWRIRATRYDDATGLVRRRVDGRQGVDDSSTYAVLDLVGKFRTGSVQHEALLGLDHENTLGRTGGELARITYNGFDPVNPVYGLVPQPTAYDEETRNARSLLRTTSVFVQDSLSLGPRWVLSAALRYQHYRQEEGAGQAYVQTLDIGGNELLPRLGMVYKWTPQLSLYGNYATSFVPNLASSATQGGFAPTKGRSYEVGAKLQLSQRVTGTLAVFDIEKKNIVVNLDDDTAQAIGKARSRGIELDLAGQVGTQLRLTGSYAFTDTEVLEDAAGLVGKRLPNAPRHAGAIAAHYTPSWRTGDLAWHFNGALRYAGARAGDTANSFMLPSYTVVDLGVGTRFAWAGTSFAVDALLRNAFDRSYYSSSDSALRVLVGAPRQLALRLRAEF